MVPLSIQAAANESEALPDVQSLRAPLRPPLSLDRELRGREEPPLVRHLPGGAAARSAVGSSHRSVRLPSAPLLSASLTQLIRYSGQIHPTLPSTYESMKVVHVVTVSSALRRLEARDRSRTDLSLCTFLSKKNNNMFLEFRVQVKSHFRN